MSDYISRQGLREMLGVPADGKCTGCKRCRLYGCESWGIQMACEAIDDCPAADVRPVVGARWEDETGYIFNQLAQRVYCPVCKSYAYFYPITTKNYCPNCGADMREEAKP